MSLREGCIREYYTRIDANDIEWVLRLFSPTAVYERAGAVYRGAEEMRDFFSIKRQIRGNHTVQHLWLIEPRAIVVIGRFDGVGAAGDRRHVRFTDVWWFDESERIERRETFLATGHGYVES